jgi:hypothetical protein
VCHSLGQLAFSSFIAGWVFIGEDGTIGFEAFVGVSATEEGDVGTCDGDSSIISC